jgi:hypothetical protein
MGVYFLAMYGLLAHGSRDELASSDVTELNDRSRRAA